MRLLFELQDNPYVTSQEKGVAYQGGRIRFYEKAEVAKMRAIYAMSIKRELAKQGIEPPMFKGAVSLAVTFCFKTVDRKLWGTFKDTKPDLDNSVKLLQDVLADLGFFTVGDQQIARLTLCKYCSDKATVCIDIEEVKK